MSKTDLEALKPWLGRTDTQEDILTPGLVEKFRATLGRHLWDGASAVPLGIHWCLTLEAVPSDNLAVDGHTKKGAFLPPVPLPSRMWAGGEVAHIAPLAIGETVTRPTQEVGYMLYGQLDLIISGRRFTVHPGDSFRIRGEPFEWINSYDAPAAAIWVIAPPVY